MSSVKSTLTSVAVAAALLGAGFLGYRVRQQVDVGKWPLLAQRSSVEIESLMERGRPIATEDRASFTEADYFYFVSSLLNREYYEPVPITDKMAEGAIKGMVGSLIDPKSEYLEGKELEHFVSERSGKYEGFGIEVELKYEEDALKKLVEKQEVDGLSVIPNLVIVDLLPGSPAEAAGLKVGARVVEVDGKRIIGATDIKLLRSIQEKVAAKTADQSELKKLQDQYRKWSKTSISSMRARDLLNRSTKETVSVMVDGGAAVDLKQISEKITPVLAEAGTVRLKFVADSASLLAKQTISDGAVIDLRHSGNGDPAQMMACLKLFATKGKIGDLESQGLKTAVQADQNGVFAGKKVKLLVDETTRGAAVVFAHAMQGIGSATIEGNLTGEPNIIDLITIDSDSAYTLTSARFVPLQSGATQ